MARAKQKPTFFWQGALIVFPVVALAAVGVVSLRQDKVLAQHEAALRAQAIADELTPRLWADLLATNDPARHETAFQVDSSGHLIFPPPCSSLPRPEPLDLRQVTKAQAELWNEAQQAEMAGNGESAIQSYREFLESKPPGNLAGVAHYALGLLFAQRAQADAANRSFTALVENYPTAVGESGLPLAPLAQLKLLELAGAPSGFLRTNALPIFNNFGSNVVNHPTPLSAELLARALDLVHDPIVKANVAEWEKIWRKHELLRELFSAASAQLTNSADLTARFVPGSGFVVPALAGNPDKGDDLATAGAMPPMSLRAAPSPRLFWFDGPEWFEPRAAGFGFAGSAAGGRTWLATGFPTNGGSFWFACQSEYAVGARLKALVEQTSHIPDYFGIGLEVAGKKLTWPAPDLRLWHEVPYFGRNGGGTKKEYLSEAATNVLASASAGGVSAHGLKVSVYLTSPAVLFKLQRARTFWFGALILASALAAWIGLIAAWRAFHRQLRLNELKSNFVSSVSHELRAPIASVRLLAESLERGKVPETPRQQEYFRFIVQECRRLSSLIENVLDFSRIEQGRKQYEFEPTDLVALTQQTVKLMEPYAAERQVHLRFALDDHQLSSIHYQLSVDGKAIQQALVNLIDNAIKHSPKGEAVTVGIEVRSPKSEVRITDAVPASSIQDPVSSNQQPASRIQHPASRIQYPVSSIQEPASSIQEPVSSIQHPGTSIRLWVEDRGEGIPPAEHEKIFERFYRRGSELRRETQGVGIGLSIVKHIVEAHGGRVLVRSDVGQGSRFTIELPAAAAEAKSEVRSPKSE